MNWTAEDASRATKEGWQYIGGNVRYRYGLDGMPTFPNVNAVIEHIFYRAATSEWHEHVYMAIPLSLFESRIGFSENWYHGLGNKIYSIRNARTHEQALDFVIERAKAGSLVHKKVLAHLAKKRLGVPL